LTIVNAISGSKAFLRSGRFKVIHVAELRSLIITSTCGPHSLSRSIPASLHPAFSQTSPWLSVRAVTWLAAYSIRLFIRKWLSIAVRTSIL